MNITISCLVVPNRPYARSSSSIIEIVAGSGSQHFRHLFAILTWRSVDLFGSGD